MAATELEEKEHGPQQKNKIKELSDQVEEVKDIMKKNLDQFLDREERLDVLLEVSQFLKDRAQNFNRTAVKVSHSYWWKNVKLIVVIVVVVLIIVLIIILLATGVIPVSAPVGPVVTPTTKP